MKHLCDLTNEQKLEFLGEFMGIPEEKYHGLYVTVEVHGLEDGQIFHGTLGEYVRDLLALMTNDPAV